MAAHKRTKTQREADLETISRDYLAGHTQAYIAARLKVSREQIKYDLRTLYERWQESALVNFDGKKGLELARIDETERTYWRAWRRSLRDKEVAINETIVGGESTRTKTGTRREGQSGNPAFLAGVMSCIDKRCAIFGIAAPKRATLETVEEFFNSLPPELAEFLRAGIAAHDAAKGPGTAAATEPKANGPPG